MPRKTEIPKPNYAALETEASDVHQQKGVDGGYTSTVLKDHTDLEDNNIPLQAESLETTIAKLREEAKQFDSVKAQAEWRKCFTNFSLQLDRQTSTNLDHYLVDVRKAILARESFVSGNMRIYPQLDDRNITLDKANVFGRGIDSARAALHIIYYHNITNEDHYRGENESAKVKELLKQYRDEINQCSNDLEGLKKAKKAYANFSGQLNQILIDANICASEKQAFNSVNLVRDYLWGKTFNPETTCIEVKTQGSDVTLYHVVSSLTFANNENSSWKHRENTAWYQQLKKKTGGEWLDNFARIEQDNLNRLSPSASPIMRTIPNPANATSVLEIIVDGSGNVINTSRSFGTAIIEPFSIKDKQERQDITIDNLRKLMLGNENQRLQEATQEYFQRWSGLDSKSNSITIPLLYQTLVVNESNFGLLPDQKKSRTMLENKAHAFVQLRKEFAGKEIYWDRKENKLILQRPEKFEPGRYCAVNFEVLDTNYCINRVEKLSKIRDEDVKGAERLVDLARMKFEKVYIQGLIVDDAQLINLNKIRDFLNDKETPLVNAKKRDLELDIAITELTKYLRQYQGDKFSHETANNIALLMQAAVELKYSISGLEATSGSLLGVANEFFESDRQRCMIHVAANQAIVADLLGERISGCMSNIDRGGELKLQIAARRRQFHIEGRILHAHATEEETNAFLTAYPGTGPKHILAEKASGISATSDGELRGKGNRGLFGAKEKPEEQELSEELVSLRKGKTKKPKIKSKADDRVIVRHLNQGEGEEQHYAAIKVNPDDLDSKNQIRLQLKALMTGNRTSYQSKAIEKIIHEVYFLKEQFPEQKEELDAVLELLYAVKTFRGYSKPNPLWQLLRKVAKRDYEVLAELELLQQHIQSAETQYAQNQDPNLLLVIEFAKQSLQNRFQHLERNDDRIIDLLSRPRFAELQKFVGQALPQSQQFETAVSVPKSIEEKLADVMVIDLNDFEALSKDFSPGQFGTLQQFRYNGNNSEILAVCDEQRRLMIKQAKIPQEPIKPADIDTNPVKKVKYEKAYKEYETALAEYPNALHGIIAEGHKANKLTKAYKPEQGAHVYNFANLAKLGDIPVILSRFEVMSETVSVENGVERRTGNGETMAGFYTALGNLTAQHATPFIANASNYIAQSVDGMANSLAAMHSAHIYHGDIAPRNFMMQTEFSGNRLVRAVPVAIDYGYAVDLDPYTELSPDKLNLGIGPIRWLSKHTLEKKNVSAYDDAYQTKISMFNILSRYLEHKDAKGHLDENACIQFPQQYGDRVAKNGSNGVEKFDSDSNEWFISCRKYYTSQQALEIFMQNMEEKVADCADVIKRQNVLDIIHAYGYYNTQFIDIDHASLSSAQIQEVNSQANAREKALLFQANQNHIIISLEKIAKQIQENPPKTDVEKQAVLDNIKSFMCLTVSESVKKTSSYGKLISHLDSYDDVTKLLVPVTQQIRISNFNSFIQEFGRQEQAEVIDVNQWRRLLQTQLSKTLTDDVDFQKLKTLVNQQISENDNAALEARNNSIRNAIASFSAKVRPSGEIYETLIQSNSELHQVTLAIQLQSPASDFVLTRKPLTVRVFKDASLKRMLVAEDLQLEAASPRAQEATNQSERALDAKKSEVDNDLRNTLNDLKERIADERNYLRTIDQLIRLIESQASSDSKIIQQRKFFGFVLSDEQKELLSNMHVRHFGFTKQLKDIDRRMVSTSLALDALATELDNLNINVAEKKSLETEIADIRKHLHAADNRLDVCEDLIAKSKHWVYEQNIKNSQLKMMERTLEYMYEDHALANKYINEKNENEGDITKQIKLLNKNLQLCAKYLAGLPKDNAKKLMEDFQFSEKQANRIVEIQNLLIRYEKAFSRQRVLLEEQHHNMILAAAEGHAIESPAVKTILPRERAWKPAATVDSLASVQINHKRQENIVTHKAQHEPKKNISHATLTELEFAALMKIKSVYPVKDTNLNYKQEGVSFSYERQENIPKRSAEDPALDAMCTHYFQIAKAIGDDTVEVSGDSKLVNSVCIRLAALGLTPKTASGEYKPGTLEQIAIAEKRLEFMKAGVITEADIPQDDAYSNTLTDVMAYFSKHTFVR